MGKLRWRVSKGEPPQVVGVGFDRVAKVDERCRVPCGLLVDEDIVGGDITVGHSGLMQVVECRAHVSGDRRRDGNPLGVRYGLWAQALALDPGQG